MIVGNGRVKRSTTRIAALAVSTGLLVALAAATSSSATRSLSPAAGVAEAKRLVKQYEQAPKWAPPGKPFDASKAKGKSIWYVSLSLSIPFEQYMLQGIQQGAKLVGAKGVGFDGKFSAAEGSRGIEQAIQAKASVIMVGGFEPSLLGGPGSWTLAMITGIPAFSASESAGPTSEGSKPPTMITEALA